MSDYLYIFGPSEWSSSDAVWQSPRDCGLNCKIGNTNDPKQCLQQLRRARPEYCFWHVHFIPVMAAEVERSLHSFYHHFHFKGEFYALPVTDLLWIESLRSSDLRKSKWCLSAFLAELDCNGYLLENDAWKEAIDAARRALAQHQCQLSDRGIKLGKAVVRL